MSTGCQFEDRLDDFLNGHARSVADWRYTTSDNGIEAIAASVTSFVLDDVDALDDRATQRLEQRMATILARAYLAGWDHASDYVRDAGSDTLADRLGLRV
jgi:MinD-like ATPase involved in chromosome partitioning or flagellar assembly